MTDHAKEIGLRGQKRYYYVFSIGTERAHRGKGTSYSLIPISPISPIPNPDSLCVVQVSPKPLYNITRPKLKPRTSPSGSRQRRLVPGTFISPWGLRRLRRLPWGKGRLRLMLRLRLMGRVCLFMRWYGGRSQAAASLKLKLGRVIRLSKSIFIFDTHTNYYYAFFEILVSNVSTCR